MYKKFLITGSNSLIGKELIKVLPEEIKIIKPTSKQLDLSNLSNLDKIKKEIISSDVIILLHSIINSRSYLKRSDKDKIKQIKVNLLSILEISEIALNFNKKARIFIMGSESGVKGSFDILYGLTKASLHKYIEERKIIYKNQQLVGIAPSTIIDGKITVQRKDKWNVKKSLSLNPKKRGIYSEEISRLIYSLIFHNTDYITNTIIHVNGGKFSRM